MCTSVFALGFALWILGQIYARFQEMNYHQLRLVLSCVVKVITGFKDVIKVVNVLSVQNQLRSEYISDESSLESL